MTHAHQHASEPETMRDFGRESWEERYRNRERVWSGLPNGQLVDEVEHLVEPGKALDVGCGEGADAVWLARQGWLVTAVDLSSTAIERAREHAADAGVAHHVTFTDADLTEVIADGGQWNLVASMYTHPQEGYEWLIRTLETAVAPAGMLLLVGHHPTDPHAASHPDLKAAAFDAASVASVLDRDVWEVSASVRERTTRDGDGHEVLWRDSVLVALRHS